MYPEVDRQLLAFKIHTTFESYVAIQVVADKTVSAVQSPLLNYRMTASDRYL